MDVEPTATEALDSTRGETATSAPTVVAVVVSDGGEALTRTVVDLAGQDYQSLSVLVLDRAGDVDLKSDLAETAPGTFVRSLDDDPGYATTANLVLDMVEGAAFFLICLDDVAAGPTMVRTLVEEAFRSNAAIVGPKQVRVDRTEELVTVGLSADKFGCPAPIAEPGEIDQEQHDSVRDVFAIAPGCVLVRADLFTTMHGFDDQLDEVAAHIDLCWRAHLAGARVLVAPDAVLARSLELDDDDQAAGWVEDCTPLRTVLSNYSLAHTVRVVPQQLLMIVVMILASFVSGSGRERSGESKRDRSSLADIRARRRDVATYRVLSDREIRRLQTRGSARLTAFVRALLGREDGRASHLAADVRLRTTRIVRSTSREAWTMFGVLSALILFGSRHLLTRSVAAVGEMARFPTVGGWQIESFSGWRGAGLGAPGTAPGLVVLASLVGWLGDPNGIVRTVLIIAPLPLGVWAAWRLGAAFASRWAAVASAATYAVVALPYNALANGEWRALWAYALVPILAARLARAGTPAAMETASPHPNGRRQRRDASVGVASTGLLVGVLALVHPAGLFFALFIAACFVVGGLLASRGSGAVAMIRLALVATLIGAALNVPVLLAVGDGSLDPAALIGWQRGGGSGGDIATVARFATGPLGHSMLGWLLLPATVLGLVIGRDWRFDWAVRGLVLAYGSFALTLAAGRDWVPVGLPAEELLLVPAAVGFALAVAMGLSSFELDLRGYGFGWRQGLAVIVGLLAVLASLPVLAASFDGRWRMPERDYNQTLSFVEEELAASGGFRLLWLGHPDLLPVAGWDLPGRDDGLAYATSDGLPTIEEIDPGPEGLASPLLAEAVGLAERGETRRLGHLLAPMAVRYIVVPDQLAPNPFGGERRPVDPGVTSALGEQLDLVEVRLNRDVRIFRNVAWVPMRTIVPDHLGGPDQPDEPYQPDGDGHPLGSLAQMAMTDLSQSRLVLADRTGNLVAEGPIEEKNRIHIASAYDQGWELQLDGRTQERLPNFGWATGFEAVDSGQGRLIYRTPLQVRLLLGLQILGWVVVVWWARSSRRRRGQHDQGAAPATGVADGAAGGGST